MNNTNFNYVSLDVIANKIIKNPLLKDMNYEDIIDHALSVIKIIKVPGVYHQESCYLDVTDHKVAIPKNALNIKTVDMVFQDRLIPMTISTSSLFNQVDKIKEENLSNMNSCGKYTITNSLIKTSFESGKIFVTFDTIVVDENNIPMVPDSEALLRAIEAYIKLQAYTILADIGKLSERSLQRAETEYYFNVGKAQTEFQEFINEDHMESFLNGWTQMFPSQNDHLDRYNRTGNKRTNKRL